MDDELRKALEEEDIQNANILTYVPTEKTNESRQPLSFLKKISQGESTRGPIIKPANYEKEVVTYYKEDKDTDKGCIRYYYPTLKEFLEKNLPCVKRPWLNGGKEGYQDPLIYRPGQIHDYVKYWYIDYFVNRGIETPFAYSDKNIRKNIEDICNPTEFTLQPHQKFVGAHLSNMTDFYFVLVYHRIGSGKCAPFGSKVLLYNGKIEEVQNIKIGDLLMGPDGKSRKVLSLARGRDIMYDIIPVKGNVHTFTSEHVLSLKSSFSGEVKYVNDKKKWCAKWFNNIKIRVESKYFESEWEARNHLGGGKICNIEIKDYIKLPDSTKNILKLYYTGIEFPHKEVPLDPYIVGLHLGDKYIPDIYKINSRDVRLQVLAGLVRAHGRKRGNTWELSARENVDDIIYLARSLGFSAYKNEGIITITVVFSGERRFKVVQKEIDDYYGFTLDGDHLYLLDDFLVTHNSGTSVLVAESNKGQYIKDGNFETRKGSLIPQRMLGPGKGSGRPVLNESCNITVVVPTQTINQYLNEIRGSIENGEIRSFTGACIYTEADYQNDDSYVYMRQLYVGKVNKRTKKPESENLKMLYEIDLNIGTLENEIEKLDDLDKKSDNLDEKKEIQNQINRLGMLKEDLKIKRETLLKSINMQIEKVYYIISHDTFLNRITEKVNGNNVASKYILGIDKTKKEANLPHPDCFHSDKSVIIIDEVQNVTSESGANYSKLYNTLMIYFRDKLTGHPRVKVILLTATPIFDNPHEASLILNLLRPRIQFPRGRMMFEDFFIDKTDKDNCIIKNKLCYQYLFSGYVSFSQGANPKGFPLRRNIIKLHEMNGLQLEGYISALLYDIKKDLNASKSIKETGNKIFENFANGRLDDNQQGKFIFSRQLCNIYLPTDTIKNVKEGEESSSESELNKLVSILREKQLGDILPTFSSYSTKFHFIIEKILESWGKNEGPIVVYCKWVWYGILPMTKVLQLLGWKFWNTHDVENVHDTPKFAIWSTSALKYMKIKNQVNYTSQLLKTINRSDNANGKLCKVLFTTVEEGISLKRVCQLHVTSPWWNESLMEQVIGRADRFCAYTDLPLDKQYVDIYYHCSVLNTYKNYPEINRELDQRINDVKNEHETKYKATNYRDLARVSIEQKVYITARRKKDINNQFEVAIKETAIDFELNHYGNLLKFEEIVNPYLKIKSPKFMEFSKIKDNERILYCRSENKYYFYDITKMELYNLNMYKKDSHTNFEYPVWPSLQATIEDKIDIDSNWDQHQIDHQLDKNGIIMVSFIVTEMLKSFNNDPQVRDKNFRELGKYAVEHKGEDKKVWDYFEEQRVKLKMFSILVGLYGISEGAGGDLLLETFNDRVLSSKGTHPETRAKIIRGTADKDLTEEVAQKVEKLGKMSKDLVNKLKFEKLSKDFKNIAKRLPNSKEYDAEKVQRIENELKEQFFTISDDDIEKMINDLISKFHMSRDELNGYSAAEITSMYYEKQNKMRNRKPGKN